MDWPADDVLMRKVREGEVGKLSLLFERHHRKLYGFFARLTGDREASEDLVQDVFFRMLKYRHTYGSGTEFNAWMYQIARNAHLDSLGRRKAEVIPLSDEPASGEPGAEERIRRNQEVRLLRRALEALPLDKREVLVLSRYQNLKYEEIAGILKCEVGAVKVRVYRALRELSEIFFQLSGEKAS